MPIDSENFLRVLVCRGMILWRIDSASGRN
jgi:hypothetical protein